MTGWSACADCTSHLCQERQFCMGYHADVKTVHSNIVSDHPAPPCTRPLRRRTPEGDYYTPDPVDMLAGPPAPHPRMWLWVAVGAAMWVVSIYIAAELLR